MELLGLHLDVFFLIPYLLLYALQLFHEAIIRFAEILNGVAENHALLQLLLRGCLEVDLTCQRTDDVIAVNVRQLVELQALLLREEEMSDGLYRHAEARVVLLRLHDNSQVLIHIGHLNRWQSLHTVSQIRLGFDLGDVYVLPLLA